MAKWEEDHLIVLVIITYSFPSMMFTGKGLPVHFDTMRGNHQKASRKR